MTASVQHRLTGRRSGTGIGRGWSEEGKGAETDGRESKDRPNRWIFGRFGSDRIQFMSSASSDDSFSRVYFVFISWRRLPTGGNRLKSIAFFPARFPICDLD